MIQLTPEEAKMVRELYRLYDEINSGSMTLAGSWEALDRIGCMSVDTHVSLAEKVGYEEPPSELTERGQGEPA